MDIIKFNSIALLLHLFISFQGFCQRVDFTLGEKGLKSLTYDGHDFIKNATYGEFARYDVYANFQREDGSTYRVGPNQTRKTFWSKETNTISIHYEWGTASCQYIITKSKQLELVVRITNNTKDILTSLSSNLFILTFPTIPQAALAGKWPIPMYKQPMWVDQHEWPGLLRIDYGTHTMGVCIEEPPRRKFKVGVKNSYANQKEYLFGMESLEPLSMTETVTFHFSLRFSPSDIPNKQLAEDIYTKFSKEFPFQINWSDRRVIGDAFLSSRAVKGVLKKNPRGWFNNDPRVDITTQEGKEQFREKMMEYADNTILILKQLDAQGLVVWDIEGQEHSGITYVGDPAMVGELAPEMAWKGAYQQSVIDAFFGKFKTNGLRTGVCIRPTRVIKTEKGYIQFHSKDPGQILIDKIAYAKKRWGCTLFYIDSNTNQDKSQYVVLDALLFKRVQEAHPDVLLIPEAENAKYFAYTAPYDELRRGTNSTPAPIKSIYPNAFSVINVSDGDIASNRNALLEAVKNGDILMCHAWFNSKSTVETQRIIAEVQRSSSSKKKRKKSK
jgi:hypothetical protein